MLAATHIGRGNKQYLEVLKPIVFQNAAPQVGGIAPFALARPGEIDQAVVGEIRVQHQIQ